MQPFAGTALQTHVEAYGLVHTHPVNKALHYVGIPSAAVAVLGLLARIRLPNLHFFWIHPDGSWFVLLVAGAWYLYSDWRGGSLPWAALLACYLTGRQLESWMLWGLLGAAAILHVIGHYGFEGKPPALLSRPISVLEAPAWLIAICSGWRLQEISLIYHTPYTSHRHLNTLRYGGGVDP